MMGTIENHNVKIFTDDIEKTAIVICGSIVEENNFTYETALLYKTLKHLGANTEYYIPNREKENHGLNTKALVQLIAKHKTKLIITVDCGVSDVEQVNFANGFKVDVIITDHHESPEELPGAYAIINPKAMNALQKDLHKVYRCIKNGGNLSDIQKICIHNYTAYLKISSLRNCYDVSHYFLCLGTFFG